MDLKIPRQWRPKATEIIKAAELLRGFTTVWARQRLLLVSLLGQKPPLSRQEIARKLESRTVWVDRILAKWRRLGVESIANFRPGALTLAELAWFRKEIRRGKIKTKEGLAAGILAKKGIKLSAPCIRAYCRGLNLPTRSLTSIPEAFKHPDLHAYKWSDTQLAELRAYAGPNPERIEALLRLGEEFCSVRQAAGSRESNLRSDLSRYIAGGLSAVANGWLCIREEMRKNRETQFNAMCDQHMATHSTCPTIPEARTMLNNLGKVLDPSAAYRYLSNWKSKRGFKSRSYKRND